jgi:hypothetical protein
MLESLEGSVGKGCFGNSFHEGIVSLMIRMGNPSPLINSHNL